MTDPKILGINLTQQRRENSVNDVYDAYTAKFSNSNVFVFVSIWHPPFYSDLGRSFIIQSSFTEIL